MEYHSRVRRCFAIQTTATSCVLQPAASRFRKSGHFENDTPIRDHLNREATHKFQTRHALDSPTAHSNSFEMGRGRLLMACELYCPGDEEQQAKRAGADLLMPQILLVALPSVVVPLLFP